MPRLLRAERPREMEVDAMKQPRDRPRLLSRRGVGDEEWEDPDRARHRR